MKHRAVDVPNPPASTDPDLTDVFGGPFVMPAPSLAARFKILHRPAPPTAVEALSRIGGGLPEDYARLLRESDGAEESDADGAREPFALWPTDTALARIAGPRAADCAPELLLIGIDGCSGYVALDRAASLLPEEWPVVRVDSSGRRRLLASSFAEWRRHRFPLTDGFSCHGG